ncbi:hypothetical protein, partial [Listeria monocytogenes]|uniref:hypothetical protein n=1 Tax=Listeria monocytogenes TaxID=1639 RepID=UPI001C434256
PKHLFPRFIIAEFSDFSAQKNRCGKGSKPHRSKREFGIFILKGGRRMKMFCLLLAYDYILTKFLVDTL